MLYIGHRLIDVSLLPTWSLSRSDQENISVHDIISQEVGRGPPRAMLFADDLVLCVNTRKEAEEQLELWRRAIENKGLRVSRSKTEYLPPSSCHDSKVKLGEDEIKNVTTFK